MMTFFPILTYHQLFDDREDNNLTYAIHVNDFERQIEYLYQNGFRTIVLNDNIAYSRKTFVTNRKLVCITFDDGASSDFFYAFPILKKYDFTGVFFITTDRVDTSHNVTWENLIAMKSEGMSIQSHTVTHPFLSSLTDIQVRQELLQSKLTLEKQLAISVDFISIPGGFLSKKVIETAKTVGYRSVCTSVPGFNTISLEPALLLKRFMITRRTSFNHFVRIVNGDVNLIRKLKIHYMIKANLRRILGHDFYYRIWLNFAKNFYLTDLP